ncbi:MAG: glycosyltransferase family 2 protein [Candidatus Omnitrophota bacterium]|nr:MAG: glycosyltransferase family 2 protein [Candidatus Omnitrophota bacterium]
MKISIIIPAYNEAQNLSFLLPEIKKFFLTSDNPLEIIVVDDGSEDDTERVAREEGVHVLRHPYNMGNGAAIKTGLRNATGDVCVFIDADLQHPPQEISKLIEPLGEYEMVIGVRRSSAQKLHRRIANRFFNMLASYVTGRKILDLTSGFRAVKTEAAKKFISLLPNGFSYPTTLTLAFLKTGRGVKFLPVDSNPRNTGRSKISLLQDGIRFVLIIAKIATVYSPFRVFLPISFFFFITGLLYYIYTFSAFHRFTNMSLLLFTTSVLIFMLSLIAEQIAQLYIKESE